MSKSNLDEIKLSFDPSASEFVLSAFGCVFKDGYIQSVKSKENICCKFCGRKIESNKFAGIVADGDSRDGYGFACNNIGCLIELSDYIDKNKTKKTNSDFYMEDVHSIALKAMKVIEDGLKEYGIELEEGQDDEIYVPMSVTIEKYSNGNYRHHN